MILRHFALIMRSSLFIIGFVKFNKVCASDIVSGLILALDSFISLDSRFWRFCAFRDTATIQCHFNWDFIDVSKFQVQFPIRQEVLFAMKELSKP